MNALKSRLGIPPKNEAVAAVIAAGRTVTSNTAAWLEANEPKTPFLPYSESGSRDCDLELHRFTWNYLKSKRPYPFEPAKDTTWRNYAVEALHDQATEALRLLQSLASKGDSAAIKALAENTIAAVKALNRIALDKQPSEALRPFARQQASWPCLKSPHKHFCEDEKQFFDKLQVAQDDPRTIAEHSNWNPLDEAGKIALMAWEKIHSTRTGGCYFRHLNEWEIEASKLPPFNDGHRSSVLSWFAVAKDFLEQNPALLSELNTSVPKSKRRRSHGISSHVFTMIRKKFLSMAGFNMV